MIRVVITDDTLRATKARILSGRLHFLVDRQGRKTQETGTAVRVLEGRHLEHALRRAARYMRRPRQGRPPRHILLFMSAFRKADPEGFKTAMETYGS